MLLLVSSGHDKIFQLYNSNGSCVRSGLNSYSFLPILNKTKMKFPFSKYRSATDNSILWGDDDNIDHAEFERKESKNVAQTVLCTCL